ncbi:MAG TPA: hypothetical protein VEM76_20020 [Anaeromyxobacteraceae bacterium]|nr:hypothetical protein [Anaeromyxobacteraceae bacterium]
MAAFDKETLPAEIDALSRALAEERYRHVAGLEPDPALQPIFAAHSRAAHRDTAAALRTEGEEGLASKVAALRTERAQAEDEESWRAAEARASVQGPDGAVPFALAQLAVGTERDRERRRAFGRGVAEASWLVAREAAMERRARARAEVGLLPDWERVVQADALLGASDDAYRDVLAYTARHEAELALPPRGDLERADLLHVLALHRWEGLFPRGMLAHTLEQTAAALRLDLGRIRIDEASRPAQWPGAHALGARVAFRRQGGAADWLALFDAAGQAAANAAAPPHRRHDAAPFTIGALLSGLLLDRGFLTARLEVERKHAPDLVRALALRQLFRLRAAAAALRVATEVERGTSGAAWHEAYREALSRAACASWPAGLAARDGDGARAAALLAGTARAERLRRSLVERHDEDWWKNPRSAAELGSWLAAGGAWAEEEPPLGGGAEPLVKAMAS